jgi:alkylhydroperoxidase family enzyme
VLRSSFFTTEEVEAIVRDYRTAGLSPAEVAMLAYAEKVTRHAYKVTPQDIDELRGHGFSDAEILDVALAAAARSFFSKTLDAVGAEPDAEYLTLEGSLREAFAVGRPFGPGGHSAG